MATISDRDSDLIGVRIPQTQDAREEKVQDKLTRRHRKIIGECTMEASFNSRVHHLNQREDDGVADGVSNNP